MYDTAEKIKLLNIKEGDEVSIILILWVRRVPGLINCTVPAP